MIIRDEFHRLLILGPGTSFSMASGRSLGPRIALLVGQVGLTHEVCRLPVS